MPLPELIEADLTWTGARFERWVKVELAADGRIGSVGDSRGGTARRLRGRALLPGFVDAHSHAFQRALRGRGEHFPRGAGSFWTWREGMYELVSGMDEARMLALCRSAFREMLAAGITTAGEFHYLHHGPGGEDGALDRALLRAASEAGIRLVLLYAFYEQGGIGQPLSEPQLRFRSPSPEAYWERADALARELDPATQSLGAAVHSIRAATLEHLQEIHLEAARRNLPFHLHVEEQRREIEDCLAAYGRRPLELILERLDVDERTTAVHCTHSDPADLARFVGAGGGVCICPLTEANLGDGIADLPTLLELEARISLGTDSNARISVTEEMRWLEYVQRLARERRGVCAGPDGDLARPLLAVATAGGARALALDAGRIAPGALADLVAVDLDCPTLEGWSEETLLAALVFGTGNEAIAEVCVGGRWVFERLPGHTVSDTD